MQFIPGLVLSLGPMPGSDKSVVHRIGIVCVCARIQSYRMSGDPVLAPLFLRIEVENHCVKWHQEFKFPCKMYAPANTAELEPCICKISVRKVSQLPNKEEENTECTAFCSCHRQLVPY